MARYFNPDNYDVPQDFECEPERVVIHVSGGVAELVSAPDGVVVEILDFDNIAAEEEN